MLEWRPVTSVVPVAQPLSGFGKEMPVQSVIHLTVSALSGTMLVLASCMLASPLLAVLVALACVTGAWLAYGRSGGLTGHTASERHPGEDSGLRDLKRETLG